MSNSEQRGDLGISSDKVHHFFLTDVVGAVRQAVQTQRSLTALVFGVLVSALAVAADQLIDLWSGALGLLAWTALWLLGFAAIALKGALVYRGSDKTGNSSAVPTPRLAWLALGPIAAHEQGEASARPDARAGVECPRDLERRARRPYQERRARTPNMAV